METMSIFDRRATPPEGRAALGDKRRSTSVLAIVLAVAMSAASCSSGTSTPTPSKAGSSGDSPNGLCGGKTCGADEFCCGPPQCGFCANKMSGVNCPATCN